MYGLSPMKVDVHQAEPKVTNEGKFVMSIAQMVQLIFILGQGI